MIKTELAYAYRILAKLGLADHTYTHLSARCPDQDAFYIYPFGMLFDEVTAEKLLKVDFAGNIIEGREYQYNKTGYVIHGSIYEARKDLNAIFHLHTPYTIAVSAQRDGLLPISQWALHFYEKISYHNYNSLALNKNQHSNNLVHDFAKNKVMFLRNHGYITAGSTVHEAMFYTHHLEQACKTQILAQSSGCELIIPDAKTCRRSCDDILSFENDLGMRDWLAWKRWVDGEKR